MNGNDPINDIVELIDKEQFRQNGIHRETDLVEPKIPREIIYFGNRTNDPCTFFVNIQRHTNIRTVSGKNCCEICGTFFSRDDIAIRFIPTCKKNFWVCTDCHSTWRAHISYCLYRWLNGIEIDPSTIEKTENLLAEKIRKNDRAKMLASTKFSWGPSCTNLQKHYALLKDDPERLSTSFIKLLMKDSSCSDIPE
jgi:hypothetical protein